MKKLVMLSMSFLMLLFFTTANARDLKGTTLTSAKNNTEKESRMEMRKIRRAEDRNEVSVLSKDAFYADFGNIPNVTWTKEQLYDVATFKKGGKMESAFYNRSDSELIGTATNKTFADLPQYAQKEINTHYKNYKVDKVIFFKTNDYNNQDMILYGTKFISADNYFVELTNKNSKKDGIVLQVTPQGQLFFFAQLNPRSYM